MLTALDVANTFLQRGFQKKVSISPMKLQKLIYIFYKTYLRRTDQKLFTETFGAWQKGPVVPVVYSEFKKYRANPITQYSLNNNGQATIIDFSNSHQLKQIFDEVWYRYCNFSATELSDMTHCVDGAWDRAVRNGSFLLTDNDIREEEDYIV